MIIRKQYSAINISPTNHDYDWHTVTNHVAVTSYCIYNKKKLTNNWLFDWSKWKFWIKCEILIYKDAFLKGLVKFP